jgi:hypothetical protein
VVHLAPAPYAEWKRGIVAGALGQARIETTLMPLLDAQGEGRRRITLHALRVRGGGEVLHGAAAAGREIRAERRDPIRRRLLHGDQL